MRFCLGRLFFALVVLGAAPEMSYGFVPHYVATSLTQGVNAGLGGEVSGIRAGVQSLFGRRDSSFELMLDLGVQGRGQLKSPVASVVQSGVRWRFDALKYVPFCSILGGWQVEAGSTVVTTAVGVNRLFLGGWHISVEIGAQRAPDVFPSVWGAVAQFGVGYQFSFDDLD